METKKIEIEYGNQLLQIECLLRHGPEKSGGKTILYLHGLGCSKDDFTPAAEVKELEHFTLAVFDFPGCGNSSYPKVTVLGMDDLVEIVNLVVAELDLGDLVIVGHSMGGLVALLYVERYGKQAKGFINVEGNLAPEDCFFSREALKYSFSEFKESVFPNRIEELSRSDNKGFREFAKTLAAHSSPKAYFDYCQSLVDYSDNKDLVQKMVTLRIPRLYVRGFKSPKSSYLEKLSQSGIEIAEIANSNHFPGSDNPKEFYAVIAGFLNDNLGENSA